MIAEYSVIPLLLIAGVHSQPSMVKRIGGCFLKTQIDLELDKTDQDSNENGQFNQENA